MLLLLSILFWNETLHVSGSSSVPHQELFTVHSAMIYVIQVCRQLSSRMDCHPDPARKLSTNLYDQDGVPSWSCSKAVYKPVWHIPLLGVQWILPDDGQRNCPKHVEFHSKINFRERSASSLFYYKEFVTMHVHVSRCTVTWTYNPAQVVK
jgi:hypothetical protein